MSLVPLTPFDLLAAAAFLAVAAGVARVYALGLDRGILSSALRLIVQLLLAGLLLKYVIEETSASLPITASIAAAMVVASGITAASGTRGERWLFTVLATAVLAVTGLGTTLCALVVVIGPTPWHAPHYMLPILALVLVPSAAAVGLVFRSLTKAASRDRASIEAFLALGHTRRAAMAGAVREALRAGFAPIVALLTLGSVATLPGLMTGQVIAGADPIEAAKYQIALLFIAAGGAGLATVLAAVGSIHILTDRRHRLRLPDDET